MLIFYALQDSSLSSHLAFFALSPMQALTEAGERSWFSTMELFALFKTQFICHLFICYVFLVSGLIVNFLQLCTLPLWCINKQLARKVNCRLAYCVCSRKYEQLMLCSQAYQSF